MGKARCWEVLPEVFIERVRGMVVKPHTRPVLESFCQKKPTTFRANTLKMSADQLTRELTKRNIAHERVSWYQDAFVLPIQGVETQGLASLQATDLYKNGCLYVQSLSSMMPPLVVDPQPTERILDIAAAPGSKTTQMAMMMHDKGEIIANDKSHVRMYKLKANLQLQGVTNTKTTQTAGQSLWYRYQEYFDKALVDVPCSMEGRFYTEDPKSYTDWSTKKIKELVQIQRFLLRSAISATKPGGIIVYSTCTLAPEENEGIIDWILQKEGEAVEILPIQAPFPGLLPGLTQWQDKSYHPTLSQTARILPSDTMEGFYIALLKKTRSTVSLGRFT